MTELALAGWYTPALSWLRLGEPARDPLSEADLSKIWAGQGFPPEALRTVRGEEVLVLHPGRLNGGPGPDFRDAVLDVAGEQRLGDVELHVRASSFRGHGHHQDPAYDGLALHLVYLADDGCDTLLSNGSLVAVAPLSPWLQQRQSQIAALVQAEPLWREPCCDADARLGRAAIDAALETAGRRRFAAMVTDMQAAVEEHGAEKALWRAVFDNLGVGGDREGFRRLGSLLTPELAHRLNGESAGVLEDALLGLAGMRALPDLVVELPPPLYPPLTATGRPANHPSRRLTALARLYGRAGGDLAAYAVYTVSRSDGLKQLLGCWQVAADAGPALLGAERARELLLNAVLPFVAATRPSLVGKVDSLLWQMKAAPVYGNTAFLENNLRLASGRRPVSSVLGQQGLLGFLEQWCRQGGCGRCPLS